MKLLNSLALLSTFSLSLALSAYNFAAISDLNKIAKLSAYPDDSLRKLGKLVNIGNSSLKEANIIFLPEIHDDENSLLTQLLIMASEKKAGKELFVLDESLSTMKKSAWDLLSQKAIEVLAARHSRQNNEVYAPRQFEKRLRNLTADLRNMEGELNYLADQGVWALNSFGENATPFFGWDSPKKTTLTNRNKYMVASLKKALKKHERVFVMLGARHVPELEYKTSKLILCPSNNLNNADDYFQHLKRRFGNEPELSMGMGSTMPIHDFLKDQKYAIVFASDFYKELQHVMKKFNQEKNRGRCTNI